jgi:uncharacterized protein
MEMKAGTGGKMLAYVDASALIKRVVADDGSALAADAWRTARSVMSSTIVYPDARAALGAMRAAERLDDEELRLAVCRLERVFEEIELIPADAEIVGLAGSLAERHALSGMEAVHLATALNLDAPRVVMLTWSPSLATAAADNGLAVVPRAPTAVAA